MAQGHPACPGGEARAGLSEPVRRPLGSPAADLPPRCVSRVSVASGPRGAAEGAAPPAEPAARRGLTAPPHWAGLRELSQWARAAVR